MACTLCCSSNTVATDGLRQQVWLDADKTLFIKQMKGQEDHLMMPTAYTVEQQETYFPD